MVVLTNLGKAIGVSPDYSHRPRLAGNLVSLVQRRILFDLEMEVIFLVLGGCAGIFADVLAREDVGLDGEKLGRHFVKEDKLDLCF